MHDGTFTTSKGNIIDSADMIFDNMVKTVKSLTEDGFILKNINVSLQVFDRITSLCEQKEGISFFGVRVTADDGLECKKIRIDAELR